MPGQPFEVWEVDGLPIVAAPTEIDIVNAGELRQALLRAAAVNPTIVVDLTDTEFCDSTGLNVLVRALQRAKEAGGEVRLAACSPLVTRLLTVTGVGTLFPIFPSLIEAIDDDVRLQRLVQDRSWWRRALGRRSAAPAVSQRGALGR